MAPPLFTPITQQLTRVYLYAQQVIGRAETAPLGVSLASSIRSLEAAYSDAIAGRPVTPADPSVAATRSEIASLATPTRLADPIQEAALRWHWIIYNDYVRGYDDEIARLQSLTPQADWLLTPATISGISRPFFRSTNNPIQDLIGAKYWSSSSRNRPQIAQDGDIIELTAGDYRHFRITDDPYEDWITIQAAPGTKGQVRILPNPVPGSQTLYLEKGGFAKFRRLVFVGDDRMAVGSENPYSKRWPAPYFLGPFEFFDCDIDGGWNAETDSGPSNKWAVLVNGLQGLTWSGGKISGIKGEHGFYVHNQQGPLLIENVIFKWLGRTAVQVTARANEGPRGAGPVIIRGCSVEDVCIQMSGGGSAFSFKGHDDDIVVNNCTVRLGLNPNLHPSFSGNITGVVSTKNSSNAHTINKSLSLLDNDFEVGDTCKGSACRETLEIRDTGKFSFYGNRVIQHGSRPAMVITGNVSLDLGRNNNVQGKCVYQGTTYPSYDAMLDAIM